MLFLFNFLGKSIDNEKDPLNVEPQRLTKSEDKIVKHPCKDCDYETTLGSNLKINIKIKHEGVFYPCDQCKFAATTAGNMRKH